MAEKRKPQVGDNESMTGGVDPELSKLLRESMKPATKEPREPEAPIKKARGGAVRGVGVAQRGFRPAKIY